MRGLMWKRKCHNLIDGISLLEDLENKILTRTINNKKNEREYNRRYLYLKF
jgi:hypothetical protein